MKLRFSNNSIRIRLSQSDVNAIKNGKTLAEKVGFGHISDDFTWMVRSSDRDQNVSVQYKNGQILVSIPTEQCRTWAESDSVGIYYDQEIDEDTNLKISIEKDFQCLHKRAGEDESDNFPNPAAGKSSLI